MNWADWIAVGGFVLAVAVVIDTIRTEIAWRKRLNASIKHRQDEMGDQGSRKGDQEGSPRDAE